MDVTTVRDQLFFTTAFLQAEGPLGLSTGTGFVYTVATGPGQEAAFLVTNKHVIEGADKVTVRFIAATTAEMAAPILGKPWNFVVEDPSQHFIGHPTSEVDVTVFPLSPFLVASRRTGMYPFYRSLTPAISMDDAKAAELDAIEDITFIGYPNGLYDTSSLLPIARRGTAASPLSVDYGGQPTFLIDASVFPGSSGSPVLLVQTGGYTTRDGNTMLGGNRLMFLGVVAAVYQRQVPVIMQNSSSAPFVHDTLNIGIVYKAKTVDEVVDAVFAKHGLSRAPEQPADPVTQPEPDSDPIDPER